MKNTLYKHAIFYVSLVVLTLFSSQTLKAQADEGPDVKGLHFWQVSMSGGYSTIMSNYERTKVPGLAGATVGTGYEYRKGGFWLGLGVEGQLISSRLSIGKDTIHRQMFDTEGDEMTYHYFMKNWHDDQTGVYVNVPFMLGFMTKGKFYMGFGAKAGVSLWGQEKARLTYLTTSTYDRFFDDFVDMPDHFLTKYHSVSSAAPLNFNLNAAGIFEMGYEIYAKEHPKKEQRSTRIKLALYAEYGFLNIYTNKNTQKLISYDPNDGSKLLLNNYYTSVDGSKINHNPFYVGVKASFLFQIPVPEPCHCLQTERGASWRNTATKATKATNSNARKVQAKAQKSTHQKAAKSNKLKPRDNSKIKMMAPKAKGGRRRR